MQMTIVIMYGENEHYMSRGILIYGSRSSGGSHLFVRVCFILDMDPLVNHAFKKLLHDRSLNKGYVFTHIKRQETKSTN